MTISPLVFAIHLNDQVRAGAVFLCEDRACDKGKGGEQQFTRHRAATSTLIMRSGFAGGSPRATLSTASMPEITRP